MADKNPTINSGRPDKATGVEAINHFITAFVFLILGLSALFWNGQRLALEDYADPKVVAGLHFITLGWLTLSIFGSLRIFTGVALGTTQGFGKAMVPWIRLIWTACTLLFPLGLLLGKPILIVSGSSLLGLALVLFSLHMVPALLTSKKSGISRWFLLVAVFSLWGTWLLGLGAALARAGSHHAILPPGYFSAHLLLALFGWVGATVVGVGSHLIPMFAESKKTTELPLKLALPVWILLPVMATLGAVYEDPFLKIGWCLAALGSGLWITQVRLYLRAKLQKKKDPGLMLAGGSTLLLGVAWVIAFFSDAPVSFIGFILVGWLTLFTLGIYHRVVPFLVWYARFGRFEDKTHLPQVKDLIDERIGFTTAISCLSGAVFWGSGLFFHNSFLTYFGSFLILCGSLLFILQLKTLLGLRFQRKSKAYQTKVYKT